MNAHLSAEFNALTRPELTPMTAYKHRREQALKQIGDAVMIVPGCRLVQRNSDVSYKFRQNSDFYYLSGFAEPDAFIVLDGKQQKATLFSKEYDELYAIWDGEIVGQERAVSEYLFDDALANEKFDKWLSDTLRETDEIYVPTGAYSWFDDLLSNALQRAKQTRGGKVPTTIVHSDKVLHRMRLFKDMYELKSMQFAAEVTMLAHREVMAVARDGMNEREIAALLEYRFAQFGTWAYGTIVGGGNNACVLHYIDNNSVLRDGDLILIDAGAEVNGYASDITRTFPVNGQFTGVQRDVYQLVLDAMHAGIGACRADQPMKSTNEAAIDVIVDGLMSLKLLSGSRDEIMEKKTYRDYFMHGTSHLLGMDVHDVGYGMSQDENLQAGMVLTVEPGIYIRQDDTRVPEAFRGIGIRIEDNIVITEDGHINLTERAPKTVDDVIAACAQG